MLTERRRKEIASLTRKKNRQQLGETLVEGVRAIRSAISAKAPLVEILVAQSIAGEPEMADLTRSARVPVHTVDAKTIEAISDVETSQGILAVAKTGHAALRTILSQPLILVLEGLQDPGNVGTLVRSAAWFGVGGVVASRGTVDLFSPKVIRASMGGIWDVKVAVASDVDGLIKMLRDAGFGIYAADMGGVDSRTWKPAQPCALILGSEAHGISPELLGYADGEVAIVSPARSPGTESLNVAVAGSILLYRMAR